MTRAEENVWSAGTSSVAPHLAACGSSVSSGSYEPSVPTRGELRRGGGLLVGVDRDRRRTPPRKVRVAEAVVEVLVGVDHLDDLAGAERPDVVDHLARPPAEAWVSTTSSPRSPRTTRHVDVEPRVARDPDPVGDLGERHAAVLGAACRSSAEAGVQLAAQQVAELVGACVARRGKSRRRRCAPLEVDPLHLDAVGGQVGQRDADDLGQAGAGGRGDGAAQLDLVAQVGVLGGALQVAAVEDVVGRSRSARRPRAPGRAGAGGSARRRRSTSTTVSRSSLQHSQVCRPRGASRPPRVSTASRSGEAVRPRPLSRVSSARRPSGGGLDQAGAGAGRRRSARRRGPACRARRRLRSRGSTRSPSTSSTPSTTRLTPAGQASTDAGGGGQQGRVAGGGEVVEARS